MSFFPGPSNPIVYAQFTLQGRWKRLLMIVGIYGLLLATAIWITTSVVDIPSQAHMTDWVRGLMMLQFVALGFGAFGVEIGVRRDFSTRMIESNRLMPVPPLGCVLGYLVGTPLFAYGFVLVNFILGATCCQLGGFAFDDWVLANVTVVFFALVIYCLIAQFALVMGGSSLLLALGTSISIGSTSNGANLLPSVSVLLFPLLSRSSPIAGLFGSRMAPTAASSIGYVMAVGGLLVIAAVAIRIAVRRYQAVGVIGITPLIGLIFLAVWSTLAAADCALPDVFNYDRYVKYSGDDLTAQIVCAIASAMLFALVPIAGAALMVQRKQATWAHRWTPIAAMAVVCIILAGVRTDNLLNSRILTARIQSCIIIATFLVTTACLFSAGYRLRRRAWIYVLFWISITWLAPVIVDAVHRSATGDLGNAATVITAFSPPGALALIWSGALFPIWIGLAGQVVFALIPAGLLLLVWVIRKPSVAIDVASAAG